MLMLYPLAYGDNNKQNPRSRTVSHLCAACGIDETPEMCLHHLCRALLSEKGGSEGLVRDKDTDIRKAKTLSVPYVVYTGGAKRTLAKVRTDLCLLGGVCLFAFLSPLTPQRGHTLATIATFCGRRQGECTRRRDPTGAPTSGNVRCRGLALRRRRRRRLLRSNTAALGTDRSHRRRGFLIAVRRRRPRRRRDILLRGALDHGRLTKPVKGTRTIRRQKKKVSQPLRAAENVPDDTYGIGYVGGHGQKRVCLSIHYAKRSAI